MAECPDVKWVQAVVDGVMTLAFFATVMGMVWITWKRHNS